MKPEENSLEPRGWRDVVYRFVFGAALGLVFAWIPLAISIPELEAWNFTASAVIVLLCASLAALVGDRFLKGLMKVLESFPPIA